MPPFCHARALLYRSVSLPYYLVTSATLTISHAAVEGRKKSLGLPVGAGRVSDNRFLGEYNSMCDTVWWD